MANACIADCCFGAAARQRLQHTYQIWIGGVAIVAEISSQPNS